MCFARCLLLVLAHDHCVERPVLPMTVVLQPHSVDCPAAALLCTCARPTLGRDRVRLGIAIFNKWRNGGPQLTTVAHF